MPMFDRLLGHEAAAFKAEAASMRKEVGCQRMFFLRFCIVSASIQALGLRGDLGKEEVAFQQAGHVSSKGYGFKRVLVLVSFSTHFKVKHSIQREHLESNIQVSQMRVAAERARAAESATLRSALTEVRAEAEIL